MKVAVTFDDGQVFQHFGSCSCFKIYDIENKTVINSKVIETKLSGHEELAGLLGKEEIDTLIAGTVGNSAKISLADAGINLFPGVTGDADKAVSDLLAGTLNFNPFAQCKFSESCGQSCGEGSCGCSDK